MKYICKFYIKYSVQIREVTLNFTDFIGNCVLYYYNYHTITNQLLHLRRIFGILLLSNIVKPRNTAKLSEFFRIHSYYILVTANNKLYVEGHKEVSNIYNYIAYILKYDYNFEIT